MKDTRNKILLAVDGSDQALEAVRYVSEVLPHQRTKVVLFHVKTEAPESFLDLEKTKEFGAKATAARAWMAGRESVMKKFLDKAQKMLVNAGFPSAAVTVNAQSKKKGIARDILRESLKDFGAVVVGRTGTSGVKDFVIGSVANKLIGKLHHLPVVVVEGRPSPKKILVAFDGSEGALMAVDCAGSVLVDPDCEIALRHIIRPLDIPKTGPDELFPPKDEAEWLETMKREIDPAMEEAKDRLINAGFTSSRVTTKIISGKKSRAKALVEEARDGGYGTIVMGRRGLSAVQEFFMGRVTNKVLHMVDNMAVWIVS
jgi:nucleotide-binding universal stress UspA family protein